ncbi:MAG: diacylglycerol kinase family protein [Myxococcota bacterium]
MRVGLLNNLRAGRSDAQVSRVLGLLRRYPDVLHVETDSARILPEALAEFARQEVDLLVLNGVDGTLQYALTELLTNPDFAGLRRVAPLRGGRTNMTALDLGTGKDPVKALEGLLVAARTDRLHERVIQRPVLRVRSSRREGVEYGMFFGAGLIQRAIQFTHRVFEGRNHGVWGVGLVTGTLLTRLASRPKEGMLTPDKIQIQIDEREARGGEFYLAFATSLSRLFLRLDPFWGTGPGAVRFTSIASSVRRMGRNTLPILRGRPGPFVTPEHGYESANADRLRLRMGCGYTIDGEIFEPLDDEVVTVEADRRIQLLRA